MGASKSRVHPNHKTRYTPSNWAEYDRSLVLRGEITVWFTPGIIRGWTPVPSGKPGGQVRYADAVIELGLTLRLLLKLPWRQTEGLLRSLLRIGGIDLSVPDHTTLSRRSKSFASSSIPQRPKGEPLHLVVDATGLKIFGQGEWTVAKHGPKGLTQGGASFICASTRTASSPRPSSPTAVPAIPPSWGPCSMKRKGTIGSVTGDGAYDTPGSYGVIKRKGAKAIVPPCQGAVVSSKHAEARNRHVARIDKVGRKRCALRWGYHHQANGENGVYRYKNIIGSSLRARSKDGRLAEVNIGCKILNKMFELGAPRSGPIAR